MNEDVDIRSLPQNDLDLQLMVTNTVWGRKEISSELKDKLARYFLEGKDSEGKDVITKKSLWGLLGYYTRDIRLGNLSNMNNELETCRYYLDLAGDLLNADMIEPFIIALSRAVTILETSQSKGGFLRKMMNTLIQHSTSQQFEAPKKGLFGGGKKGNQL